MSQYSFDVIVVGAGHAGIEAALATARTGLKTALFTISLDSVANMPCNPSIGGTGKGHLVFEIDALGGEMGYQADLVTIQSRTLNTGKGAAVRSKRVQADRHIYSANMKKLLERERNLYLIQGEVGDILTEERDGRRRVTGVTLFPGGNYYARAVIISTGTYLGGLTHVGDVSRSSGPDGLLPAGALTQRLIDLGIRMMRFKTGTPPRIRRDSIDLESLEIQYGEEKITPFSVRTPRNSLEGITQLPCYITYTNETTHNIIRENLHRSPLYSGKIHGTGPRYCPSIEDKVVRFSEKERHQLFAEPMGWDTEEVYLQGFSSSLPADVQYLMLRSLKGFENAEIMRYAYAIEYDCIDPTQLYPTLEFKEIDGLYGAGQFNGSSGYEEAAAQGLVAGINASCKLRGRDPVILPRYSSYIGTLIDDLVTKGTNEPYRIMTSRSEYRLLLRQDNADRRLTEYGYRAGLISEERYGAFIEKMKQESEETERLNSLNVSPTSANPLLEELGQATLSSGAKMADLLRRPGITYGDLAPIDAFRPQLPPEVIETVETEIKYEGYIKRQLAEAEKQKKIESRLLPADLDYSNIKGLRLEAAQKLSEIRPASLGQAARISGVNPADISVLVIYLSMRPDDN
ncbi:MAG: tRNA uridine-5-carboxymethylaminomethyl(34) synthesis enzyme MnmG [Clostridia bacterium]|nr:tRNA uridine-5-carboxymethylaminomethyl(34) synthesis enzyme MnmG [Clostridia bacterium]